MLPGPGFGAGHTNQCGTLAEGLRQVSEALELDLAALEREGFGPEVASRRLEARLATVVVLAAAVCECMANTILAANMPEEEFANIERIEMPRKWSHEIARLLRCAPPDTSTIGMLWELLRMRNSIVHPEATIFSDGETVRVEGNVKDWNSLSEERVRKYARLPGRLIETVPPSAGIPYLSMRFSLLELSPTKAGRPLDDVLAAIARLTPLQRQTLRDHLEKAENLGMHRTHGV